MTEKIIIEIYKTRTKPRKLTMTEISEVLKKEHKIKLSRETIRKIICKIQKKNLKKLKTK